MTEHPAAEWMRATHEGGGLLAAPAGVEMLIDDGVWLGGIEAVWPARLHDNLALTIGRWGGWLVQVMPVLYNDRLVLTPQAAPDTAFDHGWCYPKGGAAVLAAAIWRPDRQGAPAGYLKQATQRDRLPGEVCRAAVEGGR
jgi:hypothetical protein